MKAKEVTSAGTVHLTQHHLSMAMELAGACSGQAVPQQEGMHCLRVVLLCCAEPLRCSAQQLCYLPLAELQWVMMLEQNQAMAWLAVLE